ncbi:MAG: hypothetical protein CMJ18_19140 [Phycisphaeraceae bacterium]|nr:hypothetical protein [Phycisphaeraceae bacterium]
MSQPRRIHLTDLRSPHVPTRVSVPFEEGEVRDPSDLVMRDGRGRTVLTQGRSVLNWPDGTCRWGLFLFDPGGDDGPFSLEPGAHDESGRALAIRDGDRYRIDTGPLVMDVPVCAERPNAISYPPWLDCLAVRDRGGSEHPILRGTPHTGLRVEDHAGRTYLSERTLDATLLRHEPLRCRDRVVEIVEAGPIRAWIQIRGISAADIFNPGLDYCIQIEAYRASTLVTITVTWRHADDAVCHHLRDIRFALPFARRATQITTGMEHGATTDRMMPGSAWRVLQEDEQSYYADRFDPSGERVGLAWGSGHGRQAPGIMQAHFPTARLSVAMRDFVREYPNEIRINENEATFGLWPADAAARIGSKRLVPIHPDAISNPAMRHQRCEYDNIACHPYWAFFDRDSGCLETVRGMQKSQVIWCDADPDLDAVAWRRRVADGALEINQARVACADLRRSTTYPDVYEFDGDRATDGARVLDAAATWLKNHERAYQVTGKFDAGDLYYMWISQSLSKDTDRKHSARREHSRMGYWNNNEEDPCHGLTKYFLATGDVAAYRTASAMARHMWDIDIRHYPQLGMYTHAYGHCFRASDAISTDHFWLEGLRDHYLLTGDPELRRGILDLTRFLSDATADVDPAQVDLRSQALLLWQLANYSAFGDTDTMIARAGAFAEGMLAERHPSGFFPRYGSKIVERFQREATPNYQGPEWGSHHAWFATLALQGLMSLIQVDADQRVRDAFYEDLAFIVDHCLFGEHDLVDERVRTEGGELVGEEPEPFTGWATFEMQRILVFAYQDSGDRKYLEIGQRMMRHFAAGEFCGPEWGARLEGLPVPGSPLNPEGPKQAESPEVNSIVVRPLVPSATLRCLPGMMGLLQEEGLLS